jgi:hypothetical protein
MKLNFQGRVNNIVLPGYRSLLPVFEAVINGFHALEDSSRKDGVIRIYVRRDPNQQRQQSLIGNRLSSRRILGFAVEDNGIGFTAKNYESFETSDTDHKKTRGAKGVGRFMWLKAFDSVDVASTFAEEGKHFHRKFTFDLANDGISNHQLNGGNGHPIKTVIELRSFKDRYFGFNRNFRAYLEIVSYEKLLKDSGERNRELFRNLGLDG